MITYIEGPSKGTPLYTTSVDVSAGVPPWGVGQPDNVLGVSGFRNSSIVTRRDRWKEGASLNRSAPSLGAKLGAIPGGRLRSCMDCDGH